jgi:hypothetical protein
VWEADRHKNFILVRRAINDFFFFSCLIKDCPIRDDHQAFGAAKHFLPPSLSLHRLINVD